MAFLDDLLGSARWLDQYLGTQKDQNPNLTADEAQRSPAPPPSPESKSVAEWLASMGLLGAGPQGTSSGILRPNANGASGVDETGFNLAYPGPAQLPAAATPTGPVSQGPISGGPSYYSSPFGGLQVPTAGMQPENIDLSAAPKRAPLPVQPLAPETAPPINPNQIVPSPYQPTGPDNLFNRLQAGATNFTSGGNPIAGLLNAVQGLATGVRTDKTGIALAQQAQMGNFLYQHLINTEKMDPQRAATLAPILALDPEVRKEFLQNPKDVEQLIAKRMAMGTAGTGGAGLNALSEVQAAKALGTKQGETQQGISNAQAQLDYTIQKIDELKQDPGLSSVVGNPILAQNPGLTGKQSATIARIEQLKGQAIADVLSSVRGLGLQRATQNEIFALRDGFARLQRAQDLPSFQNALNDLRSRVVQLRTNVGTTAGVGPTPPPNSGVTKSGIGWKVIGQ